MLFANPGKEGMFDSRRERVIRQGLIKAYGFLITPSLSGFRCVHYTKRKEMSH